MPNRIGAALAFVLVAQLAACGDERSPASHMSMASPTSPTPPVTRVQPVVTGISPNVGSERGGGWGTLTGADFGVGAQLTLGGSAIQTLFQDSTTLRFSGIPAHAPGSVDVVVTNPGGLSGTLSRGYTFAPPDSFDFSGEWIAHAGPEYGIDMRFTVRQRQLVSLSCGGLAVALSAPVTVLGAEFSVDASAGVTMTGTMVSPATAVGTIDVPACASRWWAEQAHD